MILERFKVPEKDQDRRSLLPEGRQLHAAPPACDQGCVGGRIAYLRPGAHVP